MKSRYLRFTIGTAFFAAALVIASETFGWWSYSLELKGMMGLVAVVPSVLWIFFFGTNIINCLAYFGGLGFILYKNGLIVDDYKIETVVILTLLSMWLACIGSASRSEKDINPFARKPKIIKKDIAKKSAFVRMKHVKSELPQTNSLALSANFTTLGASLESTSFAENTTLNAKTAFGKIIIKLPSGAVPNVKADCAFGKVKTKLAVNAEAQPNFTLNAHVTFGKIILLSPDEDIENFKGKLLTCTYKDTAPVETIAETPTVEEIPTVQIPETPAVEEILTVQTHEPTAVEEIPTVQAPEPTAVEEIPTSETPEIPAVEEISTSQTPEIPAVEEIPTTETPEIPAVEETPTTETPVVEATSTENIEDTPERN